MNYGFNSNIGQLVDTGQQQSLGSVLGGIDPNVLTGATTPIGNGSPIANYGLNASQGQQTGIGAFGQTGQTNLAPGLSNFQKAGVGVQAGSALLNGYLGLKQYGLAKDQLAFSKESYNTNLANQTQSYNTRLEGQRRAAASADPTLEVDNYLTANKL